jgi:hypothetical protein
MMSDASHVGSGQEAEVGRIPPGWKLGCDMSEASTITITTNKPSFTEYSPGLDASAG